MVVIVIFVGDQVGSGQKKCMNTSQVSPIDVRAHLQSSVILPCLDTPHPTRGPQHKTSQLGVRWLHYGSVIAVYGPEGNYTQGGFSLEPGGLAKGTFSLMVHNVSVGREGQYVCSVSHNGTVIYTADITVTVIAPPSLSIISPVMVVHRASMVQCQAEGFMPPLIDFSWVRAGAVVRPPHRVSAVNRTRDGFFWASSSLELTPTGQDRGVNFSCVVNHTSLQEPVSVEFSLNLTHVPNVTLSALPQSTSSCPLTLVCDIDGFYPEGISVTWLQNGSVLPNVPLVQSGPGGSFWTRHVRTLSREEKMRGGEVQCVVRQPTIRELISATLNLSATESQGQEPALSNSAKASVALMIISLVLILLLSFGFSWSNRDKKKNSLSVSAIILPPRVVIGKKGRVTVSIEGRNVDKVQTLWFINGTPISDSPLTGTHSTHGGHFLLCPSVTERSPLVPQSRHAGYYKIHKQRLLSSGSSTTQLLLSSFTFIPDVTLHKGAVFKCQVSYRGKDKVVAERVSDKLTLLGEEEIFFIIRVIVLPKTPTGHVTLTAHGSSFYPAAITFRWFCDEGELIPVVPRPLLSTPQPDARGLFSVSSQCKVPQAELEKGATKVWITVHHMALKMPTVREIRGFTKKPCVSDISSLSCGQPTLLGCEVTGFYPPDISVTWWRQRGGDREREIAEEGEVWGPLLTDPRTYRATAILRTGRSDRGVEETDSWITCRVAHCSLKEPVEKHWRHPAPPSIPTSLSVQWNEGGVGVFSLELLGGHPRAVVLWAAGGATMSPLISTECEEEEEGTRQKVRSTCVLQRWTGTGPHPRTVTKSRANSHVHSNGALPRDRKMTAKKEHPPTPKVKRATREEEEVEEEEEEEGDGKVRKGADITHVNRVNVGKGLRVSVEIRHPTLPLPVYRTWTGNEQMLLLS
ncbi:hypothetical protein GN956_G20438 [Arapaima gigas]